MKVLISADMEGVTGVTFPDDCEPGHPRWEYCRRFLTADVNAAVAGFAAAGADEILVNEAHADQRNLLLDQLDERATLLIGTHKPLGMMEGIDRSPDAVAFVGYHTGAGEQGVLAHTYLPNTITAVKINGEPASEGRMNAILAAEFGVPVVLVTGDDLTCRDAEKYAPSAVGVAVKTCVDRYSAICLPPKASSELIAAGARRALATPPQLTETAPDGYTYEVSFDAAHLAPLATYIPGVERVADLTVRFTLPTMYEAIRCFRALTRVVTSGIEPTYG
ncbi:M55 family metallopeptidase [Planosporangium thailandense]|uniref:M55 family metallopeptidase n=1 Tax=Planosporangium thailandense TaxID=765197 RepID=A0ABX0YA28_9ACTN|nr:M55 family metallopeptidase [Planosporangium thailandense]NJC74258.1 M55 family metallopeptidase [Planosporangium thailandense]